MALINVRSWPEELKQNDITFLEMSTSTESGLNMEAIFFKYSLAANVKLASAYILQRLFLARLIFMETVSTCLFPLAVSCRLGSSLRCKTGLLSS